MSKTEVRVFLSSTFRDLNHEREVLMKKIFPELKAICRAKGITVTEVDLRWGITDEEAVLGRIVRTCMEEIDRCRPYFIGFLGGRYGYIPDYVEISKDAYLLSDYPWMEDAILDELSITEMEFRYGGLDEQGKYATGNGMLPHPLFYFKKTIQANEDTPRIAELQNTIAQKGIEVKEFADADEFGKMVYDDFLALIARDFPDAQQETELDRIRAYHRAFAESRRRSYIPNMQYIKTLNEFANSTDLGKMMVYATSGAGKSALLAFWIDMFKKRNPHVFVFEHYVGMGAKSNDHIDVILHLLHEIKQQTDINAHIPNKAEELEQSVNKWLGYLKDAPTLLVIDSIDQLTSTSQSLNWLPEVLPFNIKLLISTNIETAAEKWETTGNKILTVQPLTEREREALTVRYLSEYSKSLPAELVKHIAADEKTATPLFLRILLEELRLHGQHESLSDITKTLLNSANIDELFQHVLARLEHSFNEKTVSAALSFLWVSRFGLAEDEIAELCQISRVSLSALLSAFDYHLLRRNGLISFFHIYLRRAVEQRYLADKQNLSGITQQLATYFEQKVLANRGYYLHAKDKTQTESLTTVDIEVQTRHIKELAWLFEYTGNINRLHNLVAIPDVFNVLSDKPNAIDLLKIWATLEQSGFSVVETYFEALRLLQQQNYSPLFVGTFMHNIAGFFSSVGHVDEAVEIGKQELEIAKTLDDPLKLGMAYYTLGANYSMSRFFDDALVHLAKAESIAEELNDPNLMIGVTGNLGNVYYFKGDMEKALSYYRKAGEVIESSGINTSRLSNYISLGTVYTMLGEMEEAKQLFKLSITIAQETGEVDAEAHILINLASLYDLCGRYEESAINFTKGLEMVKRLGRKQLINIAEGGLGRVHINLGNFEEAKKCLYACIESAKVINDQMGISIDKGWLSFVYEQEGNTDKAFEYINVAVDVAREKQQMYELAFWLTEKSRYLYRFVKGNDFKPAQQKEYLEEAIQAIDEVLNIIETAQLANMKEVAELLKSQLLFEANASNAPARYDLIPTVQTLLENENLSEELIICIHFTLWLMKKELDFPEQEVEQLYRETLALYHATTTTPNTHLKAHIKPLLPKEHG
jgi:nephrocystin-3